MFSLSNILRYIGVICAALVIGYIAGIRSKSAFVNPPSAETVVTDNTVERITETTTTVTKPDGSSTTKIVKDTTKKTDKKEKKELPVVIKERPRQFRITVAARPEWDDKKKSVKVHPMVVISKRLWDSPAWADIIVDPGRKEGALGISLEW
jgi:hypothetical protein